MKTLFENQEFTTATLPQTQAFLAQPENIFRWAYDVAAVERLDNGSFQLIRKEESFNGTETLSVRTEGNSVSYEIAGEMLDYAIVFDLIGLENGCQIKESVTLSEQSKLNLPLKFMSPVLKGEFQHNLNQLSRLLTLTRS